MNAPVTRRALLSATAAVGVAGLPVVAVAGTAVPASERDAELFALLNRWRETRAVWDATDGPLEAALGRAVAAYPPRPDALLWRRDDFPRTSYGRAASDPVGDSERREYSARGVAWLRRLNSSVRWDEAAEARRRKIIGAHDGWVVARQAVDDAVGFTAAAAAEDEAQAAWNAADEAVKLHQPRTLAGLARKAGWVADQLVSGGRDDLGEVFARQVAAFGGLAS